LPDRFNPALALFSQTASAPSSPATASVAIARPPEKTGLESALRVTWDDLDSAIRDLLALEIDPSKYLPGDDSTRFRQHRRSARHLARAAGGNYRLSFLIERL